MRILLIILIILTVAHNGHCQYRVRDLGIEIGVMKPGSLNAITDVAGVRIGHQTLNSGSKVRTGVTAILPHGGNVFQQKVPAAFYAGNGFGKLMGTTQVDELGNIETPIILTNTLSVPTAANAVIQYTLSLKGNEDVRSVNAVVGETNDGYLNDIRGQHVTIPDVLSAIQNATSGPVEEGNTGAGTGTICFGYKGGIGTSSRRLPESLGGYTVGVLVQTNFGGVLQIDGVPVGEVLGDYAYSRSLESADGSCMIIIATDAPLSARNLRRLAKRSMLGLARTGGIASNGSGDYAIAFSTAEEVRVPYRVIDPVISVPRLHNDRMSPLFMACIEATEEAILNSLFAAESMTGHQDHKIDKLPVDEVLKIMRRHKAID